MNAKSLCLIACLLLCAAAAAAEEDIIAAVLKGDLEAVKAILANDPDQVNATDKYGYTPLNWAATRAQWEIFRLLIDSGAKVNVVGADGGTTMHRACHYDRADMVALLIDKGCDIALQNQWGRAPLHVTARRGCLDVAHLLIARGADLNAVTNEGWTPLHVAYKSGQPGMVELLIAAGADTDALDKEGMRPRNHAFERPQWIAFDPADFDQYTGYYSFGGDFGVEVWREGDKFFLCEFSIDRIYPTGPDEFFCVQEPWKVVFGRNEAGEVASIDLDFLRRTVRAQKVR